MASAAFAYAGCSEKPVQDAVTARLRKRGDPNPERRVERLWEWVDELTTRFDARCWRAPDDDCPPRPCSR